MGARATLDGTCHGLARFASGLVLPTFREEFDLDATVAAIIGAGSYVGYCAVARPAAMGL